MALRQPEWAISKRTLDTAGPAAVPAPKGKSRRAPREKGLSDVEDADDLRSVVVAIARLALAGSISLRDLQGATYITVLLATDHALCLAVAAAGRAYSGETKGRKPSDHGKGPPGPHVE